VTTFHMCYLFDFLHVVCDRGLRYKVAIGLALMDLLSLKCHVAERGSASLEVTYLSSLYFISNGCSCSTGRFVPIGGVTPGHALNYSIELPILEAVIKCAITPG